MSKFIDLSDFEAFKKNQFEKKEERGANFIPKWDNKMKGTAENPNTYEFRFLPEASKSFYKRYYYHMVNVDEKWNYMICPKTFDANNYCPICAAVAKLYKGSNDDKNVAKVWKRKEKFVANVLVVDDPRDASISDEEKKAVGKVLLFEFPATLEKVVREELNDTKRGIGHLAFDPSKDGYNFVLKVGSKPGAQKGETWPDYNLQTAKKPCAIANTDEGIQEILDKTYNLQEYLDASVVTEEQMIGLLRNALLFDLIKVDYNRMKGIAPMSPASESFINFDNKNTSSEKEKRVEIPESIKESSAPKKSKNDPLPEMEVNDAELLAELNNIGK